MFIKCLSVKCPPAKCSFIKCLFVKCSLVKCLLIKCIFEKYRDGVDLTSGYGNWNDCHLGYLGAAGVLPGCCGDAVVVAAALLLLMSAKQDQNMYLAGQLLPSSLRTTEPLATTVCGTEI